MDDQETVDLFARLAKPRLWDLLRLKVPHFYDPDPGATGSLSASDSGEIKLRLTATVQPYVSIERFVTEEKQMGFVINPGLVPLVKAIATDVRGRRLLVTRRIAPRESDKGTVAHVEGFGVRILMWTDPHKTETLVSWECLYGVA